MAAAAVVVERRQDALVDVLDRLAQLRGKTNKQTKENRMKFDASVVFGSQTKLGR